MQRPSSVLFAIVLAQFCCTSLWFAGNGVMNDLVLAFDLPGGALGHLTSAVQFGFIAGTLVFALLTIADRYSPVKVFFLSALLGAAFNLGTIWEGNTLLSVLGFRFMTGFFLAGIYPVGMKIAADHFREGLGRSLGYLVGALVLGTSFPHLLRGFATELPWRLVLLLTSGLAVLGGLLMRFRVADGPFRQPGTKPDFTALFSVFRNRGLRAAAFGYFGHMWELYAFWAFAPVILTTYARAHPGTELNVSLWSFAIIAAGGLACMFAGQLSLRLGARRTAFVALLLSGLCCLLSPVVFRVDSAVLLLGFLLFWGMVVVADSPLFSTLVARHAPVANKGTALTIVNSVGFAVSIGSLQLLNFLQVAWDVELLFLPLVVGPVLGLVGLGYGSERGTTD